MRARVPAPGLAFGASVQPKAASAGGQTAKRLKQLDAGLRERDDAHFYDLVASLV